MILNELSNRQSVPWLSSFLGFGSLKDRGSSKFGLPDRWDSLGVLTTLPDGVLSYHNKITGDLDRFQSVSSDRCYCCFDDCSFLISRCCLLDRFLASNASIFRNS